MAMADAQHRTAMAMAKGEKEYEGKLLEARQSDWKDEFVLINFKCANFGVGLGSYIRRPNSNG